MRQGQKIIRVVATVAGFLVAAMPSWGAVCPVFDNFESPTYVVGNLVGQGNYAGGDASSEIQVVADGTQQAIQISATGSVTALTDAFQEYNPFCLPCGDGTFTFTMKAKAGGGGTGTGSFLWHVELETPAGISLGRWEGSATGARGRIGATSNFTADQPLTTDFHELKMLIDIDLNTTEFFFDGTSLGVFQHDSLGNNPANRVGYLVVARKVNEYGPDLHTVILDDIGIDNCSAACHGGVSPKAPKDVVSPVGGPASPTSIAYTVTNYSTGTFNWTVSEVDATGAAAEYAWLSLDTAGGSLAAGLNAVATATIDSSALAAGQHEGFLKFTTDCTPAQTFTRAVRVLVEPIPCFAETFPYDNGPFPGKGPWDIWSSGYEASLVNSMAVVDKHLKVAGKFVANLNPGFLPAIPGDRFANISATASIPAVSAAPDGTITVEMDIEGGTGGGGYFWKVFFNSGGINIAEWYGQYNSARARNETAGQVSPTLDSLTGPGTYDRLKAVFNSNTGVAQYYLNETLKWTTAPYAASIGKSIDSVSLIRMGRGPDSSPFDDYVNIDNIRITGSASCALASCGFTVSPASVISTADEGGAANPATHDFTLTNLPSHSVTADWTMAEVDTLGNPAAYDWLVLPEVLGGTLALESSTAITATVDASLADVGENVAVVKVGGSCGGGSSSLHGVKLFVVGAAADADCLFDSFSYPDGALAAQPGWSGTAGAADIAVSGGIGRMVGHAANTVYVTENVPAECPSCDTLPAPTTPGGLDDRVIVVSVKIKGDLAAAGGNMFYFFVHDENGAVIAQWYGGTRSIAGRVGGIVTPSASLTGGWDELKMVIDMDPPQAEFLFNGASLGTLDSPTLGFTVGSVEVNRAANESTPGQVVLFDDVTVEKCRTRRDLSCAGHAPFADADSDGDVDQADFSLFQLCMTGAGVTPVPADPVYCRCFDRGTDAPGDNDIDNFDLEAFEGCASGSGVPADPNCG